MRNASVDVEYLKQRGVVVSGTESMGPSRPGLPPTAEVAWALILAVAKRVTLEDRALRQGAGNSTYRSTSPARRSASPAWAASAGRWSRPPACSGWM